MKKNRVDFYDPLYDFVSFEEAARPRVRELFDAGFTRRKGVEKHGDSISPLSEEKFILPFLSAFEFSRQSFLRQSNLAFLVYPSATHTRFAHAVGACYLGFLASQRVAVAITDPLTDHGSADAIYLSQFLEDTGWREEFYLALLLHDIGHFPFSHSLETNIEFWTAFGAAINHEEVACQLIQGTGDFYEASKRRKTRISEAVAQEHPHLAKVFDECSKIDRMAICYLISGKRSLIDHESKQHIAELRVIHALVSGLLDLDRVDHYRRDNLFTGLRTGTSINFASLLSGLTICYNPNKPLDNPQLRLSPHAVGHAISLLQTKERLTEDCFEHHENLAYEVMLHRAFNLFLLKNDSNTPSSDKVADVLLYTDEELLESMNREGSQAVRDTVFRIRYRQPYAAAARLAFQAEHGRSSREIRKMIAETAKMPEPRILIRTSKGFGRSLDERTGEWLDLQRLRYTDGTSLIQGKYSRQIQHFKGAHDQSKETVWIFTDDEELLPQIRGAIREICGRRICDEEEL